MEQGDWSELPMDLLGLIIRRLYRLPDDYARFGAVCESWRLVAVENKCNIPLNQLPGLMVPGIYEDSPTRHYLRLNHKSGFFEEDGDAKSNKQHQLLQVPHGNACRGSGYGWLFLINDELDTKLLNPFSGAEISLPSVATLPKPVSGGYGHLDKWYVNKAVYSSNPSFHDHEKCPPVIILIIYTGDLPRLAYCKLGDDVWTLLQFNDPNNYYFLDAIYYKNQFFALDADGRIMAYDIGTTGSSHHTNIDHHCKVVVKVTQYACIPGIKYLEDMFLVELQGDLVALTRKRMHEEDEESNDSEDEEEDDNDDDEDEDEDVDDDDYEGKDYREAYRYGTIRTIGFKMMKFESTNELQRWVKLKSLGENALFLGHNTSFSLPTTSEQIGCISNSIYFTNGYTGSSVAEKYGYDMGIYNLTDKSIKPLYPIGSQLTKPSPIWVTRLPC